MKETNAKLLSQFFDVLKNDLPKEPMKGPEMEIKLRDNTKIQYLKFSRSRQIAHHLAPAAKELTDKLTETGIIVQENGVTEWVSPGHFVLQANGKVQLVTDFQKLNTYVKRPIHPFTSTK